MSRNKSIQFIEPDWPAPANVRAASTTRAGGVSLAPYDSFNLATHVGDDANSVALNRMRLSSELNLPNTPAWLEQVHSNKVVTLPVDLDCIADASYSNTPGEVCVVLTADCLPVIFTNRQGNEIAAAHAGWRGLADGILENTVACFNSKPGDMIAWMGPAIGSTAFEVGDEVREVFVSKLAESQSAFTSGQKGKWLADIYHLARIRLRYIGLSAVYGGGLCTYTEKERFFSFRRDGQTGRMATLIWMELDN